jgi:hypothetical protein
MQISELLRDPSTTGDRIFVGIIANDEDGQPLRNSCDITRELGPFRFILRCPMYHPHINAIEQINHVTDKTVIVTNDWPSITIKLKRRPEQVLYLFNQKPN